MKSAPHRIAPQPAKEHSFPVVLPRQLEQFPTREKFTPHQLRRRLHEFLPPPRQESRMPRKSQRFLKKRRHRKPVRRAADQRRFRTKKRAARKNASRKGKIETQCENKHHRREQQRLVRLIPIRPRHQDHILSAAIVKRYRIIPANEPTTAPLMRIICKSSSTRVSTNFTNSSSDILASCRSIICGSSA